MLKVSEARAAQQSEVDAASRAAGEADMFDGAENDPEQADAGEALDGVDDMYMRVDTPDQAMSVSKANSHVSASKQSVVSSLKRQLQEE